MFGRKKAPPAGLDMTVNKGYINDLSPEQQEVLNQFKEWIQANDITHNPWHLDYFLLKFCRARKFELPKVKEMFENYMNYRKEFGLDTIISDFEFKDRDALQPFYPRGYCGVDKIGRPIYIERSGYINEPEVRRIATGGDPNVDLADPNLDMWREFYQSFEVLQKLIFMACSKTFQKQIMHTFNVVDCTNFNLKMLGAKTRGLVQYVSKISQDNYPEQLGQMMIVNAPWGFSTIWSIISAWLDEKTRQKIQIKGAGFQKDLLQYIEADQLIDFLGGNCQAKLEDNWGPWNEYEVVDGSEPSDVVGIRPKNDPNAKIFTIQDCLALPNYMIGETAPQVQVTEGFLSADQQQINLDKHLEKQNNNQEEEDKFQDAEGEDEFHDAQ